MALKYFSLKYNSYEKEEIREMLLSDKLNHF